MNYDEEGVGIMRYYLCMTVLLLGSFGVCSAADDGYIILKNQRTLAEIDQLYARIPPVDCSPPKERWTHLPRTYEKITGGKTLRCVMLGDSIINDTSRSCWNLVVEDRFPACTIVKVTSVRGSTGCWWYKDDDRVKRFVLDHDPDLVIIGGISQRGDIASIREVIGRVRKGGAVDILLLSGVFGRLDPRDGKAWKQISDKAHYSAYRKALAALARETESAYFDMQKPWGEYIRTSGREPGYFKRDVVHANALGEQIIGRLLAAYLSPSLTGDALVSYSLRSAGNSESDLHRFHILNKLRHVEGLEPKLAADLDRFLAFLDRWLHDRSLWKWFSGPIRRNLSYDFKLSKDSPLAPLAWIYTAKMLVWVTNEYGNIISYHEERRRFLDKAAALFRKARSKFPRNRILGMYLGEPIPSAKTYTAPEDAPEWASLQRENLERLADIITWWIDNRLQENGEYGGAWDDDCEMWRHWVPVMIAFEYPKVSKAQAFFSDALLRQDYMKDGYTRRVYDVEHTAEPSTDTITPMMHLAPEDPVWKKRAQRIAHLMKTLWTGTNEQGFLQFKSTYFSAQKVDPDPKRACDTPYHVVALQPVLLLWQRTSDPELAALITSWMDMWVHATAQDSCGKPAGIIPAAVRWPSGEVKGPGPDWWDPRHHGEPTLYRWPSAVSKLTDTLLLTYYMTKEESYLAPLRSMAACRLAWRRERPAKAPEAGSYAWCGSRLGFLVKTLLKYRRVTGKTDFDALLALEGHGRDEKAQEKKLLRSLRSTAQALRINVPGYTSEVRFTDRVFTFPRLFGADMMFPERVPACSIRPDLQLLYEMATGDRGGFLIFPANSVRWLTVPRDIAALVDKTTPETFQAKLYHFGDKPRQMGAEFYLLKEGAYTVQLSEEKSGNAVQQPLPFRVASPRTKVSFTVPPRTLCTLAVGPEQR